MKKSGLFSYLSPFLLSLVFAGCAASETLNDFFGIAMNAADANKFKIVSYSPQHGATYYSSAAMDPGIYAYAGIDADQIRIKVVNLSDTDISYNYNSDEFQITTKEGKSYVLGKGQRKNYPSSGKIEPSQSVQFLFELPSDFWQTVGMDEPTRANPNYLESFWKGESSVRIVKENIETISVKLGPPKPVILKALPDTGG